MSILVWAVLGLIIGILAHTILPWDLHDSSSDSLIFTIPIGICGALMGGYFGNRIIDVGLDIVSLLGILLAVVVPMALFSVYRMGTKIRS